MGHQNVLMYSVICVSVYVIIPGTLVRVHVDEIAIQFSNPTCLDFW